MPLRQIPVFFCHECGNPDHLTKPNKKYCSETCRQTAWNRRVTGGFALYELAMRWRIDRDKGDMAEMTAVADQLAAEERLIRKRRSANMERERTLLPPGTKTIDDNLPDFKAGKSRSKSVALSELQREALCNAGIWTLLCAAGRVPNDPEQRPENWDGKTIAELRNAMLTLGAEAIPE